MKRWIAALATLSLFPSMSMAIEAAKLNVEWDRTIIPYFDRVKSETMITKNDASAIKYRHFMPEGAVRATLVIVSGRTEFMRKYAELVYDLRKQGYSIFIYDHRGQGESQRYLADTKKGYVANFQDYVDDLKQFMTEVVKPNQKGDLFLLSHSMGGAVATEYLIQNPKSGVKKYAAVSPMYKPSLGLLLENVPFIDLLDDAIGWKVLHTKILLGKGKDYAKANGATAWNAPFADNVLTGSPERYAYAHNEWVKHPELIISGPTNQWALEAINVGLDVRANAENLETPTLILQGSLESVVVPLAQNQVAERAENAGLITFEGARHEILVESDEIRDAAIKAITDFLQ